MSGQLSQGHVPAPPGLTQPWQGQDSLSLPQVWKPLGTHTLGLRGRSQLDPDGLGSTARPCPSYCRHLPRSPPGPWPSASTRPWLSTLLGERGRMPGGLGGLFTTLCWPECPVSQWHRQGGGAPHPHHPPWAFPTASVFPVPHVPLKQRIHPLSSSTDPAGLGLEAGGEKKPTAAQNREGTRQRCPGSQPTVGVLPSREAFCKRGAGQK